MEQHKHQFHGSDLEKVEAEYGIPRDKIIGFGSNVNPFGVSSCLKASLAQRLDCISTYPDRAYRALRTSIALYCHVDIDHIIVGNGSTELISLFIQCRHPKKAMLLAPTYSEYERELSLCGGVCTYFYVTAEDDFIFSAARLEEALTAQPDVDMLILCNPNNPTSGLIPAEQMQEILTVCAQKNIFVLVDETYVEFAPDVAEATAVTLTDRYRNLAVLRGTSKFFAAPGLRLGYAITGDDELIGYIKENKNPWTINSIADLAGQLMFGDTEYINNTRDYIAKERSRIKTRLSEMPGLHVFEPYANFFLVRIDRTGKDAGQLFEAAIREGMMIRNCATFPSLDDHYFRFCIMRREQNDKLLSCIDKFINTP